VTDTALRKPVVFQLLMVGGFSLIAFFFIKLMGDRSADSSTSWFIYYFSFIANFPHFLSSYHLLYYDCRDRLFSNYRFWVASLISPAILLALLIYGMTAPDIKVMGQILNAMYFFVGWHYIKQTFGVISVCNAQEKISFTKSERFSLKAFLYTIWAVSWISLNSNGSQYAMEGIPFTSFALEAHYLKFAYAAMIFFALYNIRLGYQKYLREGRVLSSGAYIAILALLVWYLPVLYNPTYFLVVPLFHSLQYLYFVYLVKSNQAEERVPIHERTTPAARKVYFNSLYGYLMLPFITGAIFMWHLPQWLDAHISMSQAFPNANPFMFAFTIFINIHHYFIDHAMWRHDNPMMRKYLFVPEVKS
jgi:hypothetical protein